MLGSVVVGFDREFAGDGTDRKAPPAGCVDPLILVPVMIQGAGPRRQREFRADSTFRPTQSCPSGEKMEKVRLESPGSSR
jgi:hypothetical protein